MGKQGKLLMVVIVFALAHPKVTLTALDPLRSKETGKQTLIRQIIYLAANGSAVGVSP